jgi:uncharacterized membrane protein
MVIAGALLLVITFSANSPTAKQMQNVFLVLIGGLIFLQVSLFIKSLFSDRKAKSREEGARNQSTQPLIGLFLNRKARQSSVVYFFLLLSLFVSWYLSVLKVIPVRIEVFLFISALIVANFVGQKILEYRIKKGLFGANEYEAREIINFILSNTNWSEFTSGRGGKGIFPEPEGEFIPSNEALNDVKG